MSETLTCQWCGNSFKTEDGLQWHVEAHQREAGLVIYLRPEWAAVGTSIGGVPGKYLIVLPSLVTDETAEEDVPATLKRDLDRFRPIIEVIKRQQEAQ